jgi:hypothetical protein
MCGPLIDKICFSGTDSFRCTVKIWDGYYKFIRGNYDPELPEVKDFTETKKFVLLGGNFFEQADIGMLAGPTSFKLITREQSEACAGILHDF